ncbi:hypothetical protein [Bathymodiolus japonicus methanotrophic gill symbiont]|uniref:hypothetical protein n=1 Tax=Bathymodiolus japonicus methanotrophic gill symbiont TaxID=113269 RepID=UPI001C8EEDDD|nr:hypothetical protein [Bathymodiolus japonicus methanotrophic gill symbiont]
MAFYFVSTFANAQTPTKQRPYGYRGLKIITSLRLRFPDFQRLFFLKNKEIDSTAMRPLGQAGKIPFTAPPPKNCLKKQRISA